MTTELKVHPSFFKEFATKTWVSPTEIVKELVENAFDEDATKVLVSVLKNGSIVIEDDAGMDQAGVEKFLLLGSPHKRIESISPRFKRIRTGRYGTGRLSFLTSFESMKIKTRRGNFSKSIVIDATALDNLFTGNASLAELKESPLRRDGTELTMSGAKMEIDGLKLTKEIRKLAILRQAMFEVYVKEAESFKEWDFAGAQIVRAPDIQGHRIPVNLENGKISGEIIIARRPLSDEERGIAVMVGNHIVTRSNFGFDTKLNRVTGYVRCDSLTSRFADKSALIEDDEYFKFNQAMKTFVIDTILPSLTEYEDVLITREESRIYREIDKVLGQALVETLETQEEVQGYEMVDIQEVIKQPSPKPSDETGLREKAIPAPTSTVDEKFGSESDLIKEGRDARPSASIADASGTSHSERIIRETLQGLESEQRQDTSGDASTGSNEAIEIVDEKQADGTLIRTRKIRRPVVKKTFALKKIGYKVIPYEDESDSRYSFTNENVVFVNKANSTYRAESARGDEFLMRHIISIVAEAIAEAKHPEGKEALELQNRLVAEAIRIHDYSVMKK
jgi:hypothetical protein